MRTPVYPFKLGYLIEALARNFLPKTVQRRNIILSRLTSRVVSFSARVAKHIVGDFEIRVSSCVRFGLRQQLLFDIEIEELIMLATVLDSDADSV
ncbi:MAG: hypothetical protein IPP79_21410 [Chitinophagaceae bacterium]|nr:hypothetical protein [Chitinophagaceae bacterium]